jgi:hypothetical protein
VALLGLANEITDGSLEPVFLLIVFADCSSISPERREADVERLETAKQIEMMLRPGFLNPQDRRRTSRYRRPGSSLVLIYTKVPRFASELLKEQISATTQSMPRASAYLYSIIAWRRRSAR